METLIGVIVGIIVLIVLVSLHELGHAIVAYRNGVTVREFGIGFPPKAWGKKLTNGVLFTINWLPLGGFVRLKGEYDAASKPGDYGAASYWVKTKIMLAGVLVNWLVAALLFTVLAWVGLPKIVPDQFTIPADTRTVVTNQASIEVVEVVDDSVAAQAGVAQHDQVVALNGQTIQSYIDLQQFMDSHYGDTITMTVMRAGQTRDFTMTLPDEPSANGAISGIATRYTPERATMYATWSAPLVGVGTTAQLSWKTLAGVGKIFVSLWQSLVGKFSSDPSTELQGKHAQSFVANSVTGPIGIVGSLFPQIARAGISATLFFAAIISLSLAVMNILPIPALDGGRWYIMTGFRLAKQKLTRAREENIQAIGMLVILLLFVLISISDVGKLIG